MELRKKYLHYKGEIIEVTERDPINLPNFFYDKDDCLYAYADETTDLDHINRCGIQPFALPSWAIFRQVNEFCTPHDFMYSSPVFQAFNYRSEADDYLRTIAAAAGYQQTGEIFQGISQQLGASAWENESTRDK